MTSIEWLINELVKADKILDGHRKNEDSTIIKLNPTKIFEQAKEMHKQEIIDAYNNGCEERNNEPVNGEQYYNEMHKI